MLVNRSITNLYVIESASWEAIDLRVEKVLDLKNLESVVAKTIPGYPELLKASSLWTTETFGSLIAQSNAVYDYASTAILKFTALYYEVYKIEGNEVPKYVQDLTKEALNELTKRTSELLKKVEKTSLDVSHFMKYNHIVDHEMAIHSESLGIFWESIEKVITEVSFSVAQVTGGWQALADDLDNTLDKGVNITLPFIMSLDIKASLKLWEQIIEDTRVFSGMIKKTNI